MPRRTRQLTFDEFGRQFIEQAVTPQVIGRSLSRIVPIAQRLTLEEPTRVSIDARTEIGAVERVVSGAPERELVFAVPLRIHLALVVKLLVGQERYMALAETTLRLTVRTFAPLTIQIDCDQASAEQVSVVTEGDGNWFDLVKRLGVLDSAIRQQVADLMNQHIHASRHLRTIDVRKLIAQSADLIIGAATRPSAGRRAKRPARDGLERAVAGDSSK